MPIVSQDDYVLRNSVDELLELLVGGMIAIIHFRHDGSPLAVQRQKRVAAQSLKRRSGHLNATPDE